MSDENDKAIPGGVTEELSKLAHDAHDLVNRLRAMEEKLSTAAELYSIASVARFNAEKVARSIDQFIGRHVTKRGRS